MPDIASAIRKEIARINKKIAGVQERARAEASSLQAQAAKHLGALAALGGSKGKRGASSAVKRAKRGGNMERVSRALKAGALGVQELARKTGIAVANLHQTLLAMRRKKAVRRVRKGVYGLAGSKPKRAKVRRKAKRAAKKAVRKTRKTAKKAASAAPQPSAA